MFAEPTLSEPIDAAVLKECKSMSLSISQWREKFEIIKKVSKKEPNVKFTVKEEELKMESVKA